MFNEAGGANDGTHQHLHIISVGAQSGGRHADLLREQLIDPSSLGRHVQFPDTRPGLRCCNPTGPCNRRRSIKQHRPVTSGADHDRLGGGATQIADRGRVVSDVVRSGAEQAPVTGAAAKRTSDHDVHKASELTSSIASGCERT